MAHAVEGTSNEGELESDFENWLRSHGVNAQLTAKITAAFNSIDELRLVDDDQINDVMQELDIKKALQKIKFKYVCGKAKADMIQNVISTVERKAIQEMSQNVKEMEKTLHDGDAIKKNIDDEVVKRTKEIQSTFKRLASILSKREADLLRQLNEIANAHKEKINARQKRMNDDHHNAQTNLMKCRKMIVKATALEDMDEREENVLKMGKTVAEMHENMVQIASDEYTMNVSMDANELIAKINEFGDVRAMCVSVTPALLSIDNATNPIQLKWKLQNIERRENAKNERIKVEWSECDADGNNSNEMKLDFSQSKILSVGKYHAMENQLSIKVANPFEKTKYVFRLFYFDSKRWSQPSNTKAIVNVNKRRQVPNNFVFNTEKHGDDLQFMNGNKVKKINKDAWSTCIFGEEVTDQMCNQYDVYIKWNVQSSSGNFLIGFTSKPCQEAITNWNHLIGNGDNKEHSTGYQVYTGYNDFRLYNKENNGKSCDYKSSNNFKKGDTFRLSFNFSNDQLTLYHNGHKAETLGLKKCKRITAAFSLAYQNEEIEVTKYTFS
eukprot:149433_1